MSTMQTISHEDRINDLFETVRKVLPWRPKYVDPEMKQMRYVFRSAMTAKLAERIADTVILAYHLPLTSVVETWSSSGVTREVALVIEVAPKMDFFNY